MTSISNETFDADAFLNEQVDAPMATDFTLCPAAEYLAYIHDFNSDAVEEINFVYKQGPNAGSPGTMKKFGCPFIIPDEKARAHMGKVLDQKLIVEADMILDIDPETGKLSTGINKNVLLGKVRDAVGQNNDPTWNLSKLRGAGPLMIRVVHRQIDTKNGKITVARVDRVAPLAKQVA